MISSGSGLTFVDNDVAQCRIIIGLLGRAHFRDLTGPAIVEAAPAFKWLEELLQKVKDNVYDLSQARIIEADKPEPPQEITVKPSKKGKKGK